MNIDEILNRLQEKNNSKGLTLEVIKSIEKELNVQFPESYVKFLQTMGESNRIFKGNEYSPFNLKLYHKGASQMVKANFGINGKKVISENEIVFIDSQGCNYFYFSLDKGDDPPVHFINEEQRELKPNITYKSFSDFLRIFI